MIGKFRYIADGAAAEPTPDPASIRIEPMELVTAEEAGALCKSERFPEGMSGPSYRVYANTRGAPKAVARELTHPRRKLWDAAAVRAWNAGRGCA